MSRETLGDSVEIRRGKDNEAKNMPWRGADERGVGGVDVDAT